MAEEVAGIDTIIGLVGEPPRIIPIPFGIVYSEQILTQGWNKVHIAMLPFCFKCKEPLVWHRHSDDNVLFHCPKCGRKWVRDKNWRKDAKKYARAK